jgi:hypothetical protein
VARTEAAGRAPQALRLALSALAGLALAGLTLLAWGGHGPAATVEGVVLGVPPSARVLLVATRNDCADPDRNPVELARTIRDGPGPFALEVPEVGPGIGWVCAYELDGHASSVGRYAQVWVPRRPGRSDDGRLLIDGLELRLIDGPALPDPEEPAPRRAHHREGPR